MMPALVLVASSLVEGLMWSLRWRRLQTSRPMYSTKKLEMAPLTISTMPSSGWVTLTLGSSLLRIKGLAVPLAKQPPRPAWEGPWTSQNIIKSMLLTSLTKTWWARRHHTMHITTISGKVMQHCLHQHSRLYQEQVQSILITEFRAGLTEFSTGAETWDIEMIRVTSWHLWIMTVTIWLPSVITGPCLLNSSWEWTSTLMHLLCENITVP